MEGADPLRRPEPEAPTELGVWYAKQYAESVGLDSIEGGEAFRRLTGRAFSSQAPLSGRTRVMKNYLCLLALEPVPGELRAIPITASAGDAAPVIAVFYAPAGAPRPTLVAWGPSMESRDGEFRAYLSPLEEFLRYESPLEAEVLEAVEGGQVEVSVRAAGEADARWAEEARAGIISLCRLLDPQLAAFLAGRAPPHLSRDVRTFLGDLGGRAPRLAEAATKVKSEAYAFPHPCAKLAPLFVGELTSPGDLRYGAWREASVAREASRLVLNFLTPAFPFHLPGAYVRPSGPSLFNNDAMRLRFARGREAARVARALREARRELAGLGAQGPSAHAAAVDAFALEALEHAQGFLLVSETALLHRGEFVGFTLGELRARIAHLDAKIPPAEAEAVYGALRRSLADPDTGARHLFEYAHALHCLHGRAGAAHADIHSNNITLFDWRRGGPPALPGDSVLYSAGPRGEADAYVFPADGCSSVVIDFSRAILGPGFPGAGEVFFRDQVGRALRALHRHRPDFVAAHQAELKGLIISSFELVFPLVCAGDFIALGGAAAAVLEGLGSGDARLPVDPSLAPLARALEAEGQRFLAEGLGLAVAAAGGDSRPLAALGFPGAAILPRVFGAWRFPRWAAADPGRLRRAVVVDAYLAGNPLRYESSAPAGTPGCPPWADPAEIARHLGDLQMADLFPAGLPGAAPAPADPAPARLAAAERAAQAAEDALPPPPPGAPPPPSAAASWLEN